MKTISLRNKNQNQLQQDILDLLNEQFKLRMQRSARQLTKSGRMKTIRRNIARIKTIIHEEIKKQ